jgi:hypothetical protein
MPYITVGKENSGNIDLYYLGLAHKKELSDRIPAETHLL